MQMKKAFLTFLLLISFPLMASHIVGGEFELIHISGSTYRLNLIIYFDQINGDPGAKDGSATVSIFRKRDNQLMGTVTLVKQLLETNVPYTQPACSSGEIITTKLLYTSTLQLSAANFSDPLGYYVSWQRCCRNYQITNIVSRQPPAGSSNFPDAAGQTFYLEFPPVVKNGQPFINSSPRLFPPLNDFACPTRPYYVDFAGIDDDGDSLVYSLVTPLNTVNSASTPPITPGPYPEVRWQPGFSLNKIVRGSPDLRISRDGLLTVTPTLQGLFVFAVKVEEFRDREKIGESRRDFQMLVVDACPVAEPPQILGKRKTDVNFTFDENMSVSFSNTTADEDRCIQVRISDPDASKPEDNFTERVSLRAVSLNFRKNINEILPTVTRATLVNGSTVDFDVCFPKCPYFEGGAYQIGLIAMDDACSLPLLDTLKVLVNVQPPLNRNPYFVDPVNHVTPITLNPNIILNEGGFYEQDFEIHDDDNDELIVSITTNGFLLADAGITVDIEEPRVNGLVKGKIRWNAFCDIFDFTQRTNFIVKIIADDNDLCDFGDPVTAEFNLAVILPGNADPFIDSDLTSNPNERYVLNLQRRVNESISFQVTGEDLTDNDLLVLDARQRDSFAAMGITFPASSGNGTVSSRFTWDITCSSVNLKNQDTFDFQFIVVDNSNKCRFYKADTLDVRLKILPPRSTTPVLSIRKGADVVTDRQVNYTLGESIRFDLTGTDADVAPQDLLSLTLIDATGNVQPEGFSFTSVEGRGRVESALMWSPDCSVFKDGVYENTYTFRFRLADDRCFAARADTARVHIVLKDIDGSDRAFVPPNVFTPNGDGCNDYFALEGIDPCPFNPDTGFNADRHVSLPLDNCEGRFESIRIYNRWGNAVFESNDRRFRWGAPNQPAGVYYYIIQYSNREFKGSVSVRF